MNRQLGTKWFVFYTKIRPAFAIISVLDLFFELIIYGDVYFSNFWLALYFLGTIANVVLSILVAVKSNGDYKAFVRFVKYVLLFEVVNTAYQVSVSRYVGDENVTVGLALMLFAIIIALGYFLWYRLNIQYFTRRIAKDEPNYNYVPTGESTQIEGMKICKNCGQYYPTGAVFCPKCGNKIEEDEG